MFGMIGKLKGVILMYGNYWVSVVGLSFNLGFCDDDCWLVCMLMFYVGGLFFLMKNIMYGMCILFVLKYDVDFIYKVF